MKIYFYHTRPTKNAIEEFNQKTHPGHILYGITELPRYGIEILLHDYKYYKNRILFSIYNSRKIFQKREEYSVLYATHTLGIEFIIFMKILGIYHNKIVIWQHRKVHSSSYYFVNLLHKLFYHSIDHLYFFTPMHVLESIETQNVSADKCQVINWGADLDYYDFIEKKYLKNNKNLTFISTGKENRDIKTLLNAFNNSTNKLKLFLTKQNGNIDYETEILSLLYTKNIDLKYVKGICPHELALEVNKADVVVVCCKQENYSVGLTSMVEALALGKPLIVTGNPYHSFDVEKEGCGIKVSPGDLEGWKNAINYLAENPNVVYDMGKKSKQLAIEKFNLKNYSLEIINAIIETK